MTVLLNMLPICTSRVAGVSCMSTIGILLITVRVGCTLRNVVPAGYYLQGLSLSTSNGSIRNTQLNYPIMTKIEIIDETVAFYAANTSRRAMNGDKCMYSTGRGPEEARCAVGRCMTEEAIDIYEKDSASIMGLTKTGIEEGIDSLLLPRYHGHDIYFWRGLQSFHDYVTNWGENDLTEIGKINFQLLRERYQERIAA